MADARWFSACDKKQMVCSGDLLGRWIVTSDSVKPFENDFQRNLRPPEEGSFLGTVMHVMLYDFCILPSDNECLIVQTDLDGGVERMRFNLPGGVDAVRFGELKSPPIHEKITRAKGDDCVPLGWRFPTNK